MNPVNRRRIRNGFQYMRKRNLCRAFMIPVLLGLLCCVPVAAYGQALGEGGYPVGAETGQSLPDMSGGQDLPETGTGQGVQTDQSQTGSGTGQDITGSQNQPESGSSQDGAGSQNQPESGSGQGGTDSQNQPGSGTGQSGTDSQNQPGTGQDASGSQSQPDSGDDQNLQSGAGDQPDSEKEQNQPEPEEVRDLPELEISVVLQKETNACISWKNAGAVSYKVQRSSQKKGPYKTLATLKKEDRKYIDKTAGSGTKYYYRVRAILDNNENIYSKPAAFTRPYDKVTDVKLARYSSDSVTVSWKKSSGAPYYRVYCSKTKGKYEYAGITKTNRYRVKNLQTGQKYYFYVQACVGKNASKRDSAMSKAAAVQVRAYERKTIFAGDSITAGLSAYHVLDAMAIPGVKNVVADIGLNTTTFRTRRVFDGKSGLEQIISSKPYRVYLMLGMNEIHYRSSKDVAAGYLEIVQAVRAGTPGTDIVLLSVSPVTKAEQQRRTGFAQIPDLNKKIKAIADSCGVRYYDYTGFLKDAEGYLKSSLASSDGVHWTSSAYQTFANVIKSYDQSLD